MLRREQQRSWLQENIPEPMRARVAEEIRYHRKSFFKVGDYERGRDFKYLLDEEHWDARGYLQQLLREKSRLDILDSGAGWLEFSRDVKDAFGGSVHVTALNPVFPIPPKQEPVRGEFLERVREEVKAQTPVPGLMSYVSGRYKKKVQEGVDDHMRRMARVEENYGLLDDYRVSTVENYSTDRKHDVVVDLSGPLMYSRHPERVLEVYFNTTKDDGTVILGLPSNWYPNIQKLVNEEFGQTSKRAKETGGYFRIQRLTETIFELKKTRGKVMQD